MSDDIELNVMTLEPEEDEEEYNEKEYSYGQRVPMRKPATLVQYWINTGNTPYKALLDKKELSESGTSLSEEEIISPSCSSLSNKVNESDKNKHENNTSFSSVDTAAYILSNANITKKADIVAIIEGAKSNGVKSSENDCVNGAKLKCNDKNDKTECIETIVTDHVIRNENSNDVSHNDFHLSMENVTTETNNQLDINTLVSSSTTQPEVSSPSSLCDSLSKTNALSTSQTNLNNIVSIFRHFNKASKRLSIEDKSKDTSGKSKTSREHSFSEKPVSVDMEETVGKDANLMPLHRKKLYTGRNSPVDLILFERHSTDLKQSNSSNTKLNSHPALDPDNSFRKEKSVVHKDKNKRSISNKKTLDSKKVRAKRRRKRSVSDKNITNDGANISNNNNTVNSVVDNSLQNLLASPNNVDKRDNDNLIMNNDINVSMRNIIQKYNLTFFDLNPVVSLEQIPSLKIYKSTSAQKEDITQENRVHNDPCILKLHHSNKENLELMSMITDHPSNQSTILICECTSAALQDSSSSYSSFHLRLSTEEYGSVMNVEGNNKKSTNLKNGNMNQIKEAFVILEQIPQLIIEKYTNTRQITNQNMNDIQNVNDDLSIRSERLRNKRKMDSSNSHKINIKDYIKSREVKVVLERLPADIDFKRSSNDLNMSLPADKNKISQDKNMNNKKEKSKNMIGSPDGESKRKRVRRIKKINNRYSLRIHNTSKKSSGKINNTSSDSAKHDNKISDKTESNFTLRYKNHDSRISRAKRRKLSVLNISSDEEDFVRLIQPLEKKSKTLIKDETGKTHITKKSLYDEAKLVSTNKDKRKSSENTSTIIYSSERNNLRKVNRSIRRRNRRSDIEKKSFDSDAASSSHSFQMCKENAKRISLFPNRSGSNDSSDSSESTNNVNGRRKSYVFSNSKNISKSNERHLNKVIKKNGINRKDDTCVTLFQTKTFNTQSSDSDRSNSDITPNHKSTTISVHDKERLYNGSHAKMHTSKRSDSLDSIKGRNIVNRMHNKRKILKSSVHTVANTNEQFDEKLNNNSITMRTMPNFSIIINDIRDALVQKDNKLSDTSFQSNDHKLRNRQILEKHNLKNSQVSQQCNVESAINKTLVFQTKSYYDSDSSEYC
ncbi:dentin sialophosphoprotein isoform X2 [Harpegnathos saltator]|nr:dentin sialophosphoprotein isoform X2 [Harpegnathos saltator]